MFDLQERQTTGAIMDSTKVFISWSGVRSRYVAEELRSWLPSVVQSIEPWMSTTDLPAGNRWILEVGQQLNDLSTGIVCVTPENSKEPWLNCEAGALAKALQSASVCPYVIAMELSEVPNGPLTQFQMKRANREGTFEMLQALNMRVERPLSHLQLERAFDAFWPELETALSELPETKENSPLRRSSEDMVEEVLTIVRDLHRSSNATASAQLAEGSGWVEKIMNALVDHADLKKRGIRIHNVTDSVEETRVKARCGSVELGVTLGKLTAPERADVCSVIEKAVAGLLSKADRFAPNAQPK